MARPKTGCRERGAALGIHVRARFHGWNLPRGPWINPKQSRSSRPLGDGETLQQRTARLPLPIRGGAAHSFGCFLAGIQ